MALESQLALRISSSESSRPQTWATTWDDDDDDNDDHDDNDDDDVTRRLLPHTREELLCRSRREGATRRGVLRCNLKNYI